MTSCCDVLVGIASVFIGKYVQVVIHMALANSLRLVENFKIFASKTGQNISYLQYRKEKGRFCKYFFLDLGVKEEKLSSLECGDLPSLPSACLGSGLTPHDACGLLCYPDAEPALSFARGV